MKLHYDSDLHALYLILEDRAPAYGVDLQAGLIAHYDAAHCLVGLELLDVSGLPFSDTVVQVPVLDDTR